MADLSRTIEIIFDSVDNTAGVFGAVGQDLDDLSGNLSTATQPLADLTQDLLAAEAAALAIGSTFAAVAVNEAGKFGDAFAEISTLVDTSDENLASLKDELLAYASTSTQSLQDITGATYNAISAGVEYTDALDALAVAEKLAVAGKTDLNTAMELLVPTLNSYGTGMEDAAAYSDILFTTVKEGKTTLPELEASLGDITPIAAAMGVPLEEVGAALATLTANGMETSQAGTALTSALNSILQPSQSAAEAAQDLGLAMGATALESEGLEGWLQNLIEATGGNVDEIATLIGSEEALKAIMSLTSQEAEVWNSKLEAMEIAAGATGTAFEIMADKFELGNQRLQNAATAMLVEAGEPLLEGWGGIAASLAEVFNGLGEAIDDGAFDPIYTAFETFAGEVETLLNGMADNLPVALEGIDWSGILDAMGDLGGVVSGLFDGADLTTAEGLERAIQAVVDVGESLIRTTDGIITAFGPFLNKIGEAVQAFADLDRETQAAIGEALGWGTVLNTLSGGFGGISEAVGGAVGVINTLLTLQIATKLGAMGGAASTASAAFAALGQAVAAVGVAFAAYKFGEWVNEVTGLTDAAEALGAKWAEANADITGLSDDALSRLPGLLQEVSDSTGLAIDSLSTFNDLANDGAIVFDEVTDQWVRAGEETDALAQAQREANEAMIAQSDAGLAVSRAMQSITTELGLAADGTHRLRDGSEPAAASTAALAEQAEHASIVYRDMEGNIIGVAGVVDDTTESVKDAGDEMALTAEKAAELDLKWAELASNERSLMFELAADIQVAQIEADAQRVTAAFGSLSTSFESTGDVINELTGLWANMDDWGKENQLEAWLEDEFERRDKLMDAQIKMVEAETKRMEAQADMMQDGGLEININNDDLEPALEAFMFSVIDKVRLSVAGSYEQFLLGAGCDS